MTYKQLNLLRMVLRLPTVDRQRYYKFILSATKFIYDCKDPYVKSLMQYRFIKRCSWVHVGIIHNLKPDAARMLVKRYLEKTYEMVGDNE